MILSCQTLDVLHAFYIFFGTNLLTHCQVPVPVFSMFLTPLRGDFETESKRKKNPEMIFSRTEEVHGALGQARWAPGSPQAPTPPPGGRRRWAGLWPPWPPPDLGLWPINSQIFRKKSGEPRKYFSAAASFRFREISSRDPSRCPAGGDFGAGGLLHQPHCLSNDS